MTTVFTFKWDEEEDSGPEDMVQQLSFLGAYDVEYEEMPDFKPAGEFKGDGPKRMPSEQQIEAWKKQR